MSEEKKVEQEVSEETSPEQQEQEQPELQNPEVIEVEWEEAKELVSIRAALNQTESELSRFLLQVEKKKAFLLSRVEQLEAGLYQLGSDLQAEKGIDSSFTYELKLPAQTGEKGYFIRKQQ